MGLPNNQNNTKNQIEVSKQITDSVKNTQNAVENLAAIVRGIELKLIDPKDQAKFEKFLSIVSKTEFSNWSELNKILNLSIGDLAKFKNEQKEISKKTEKELKKQIKLDELGEDSLKRLERINKEYTIQEKSLDKIFDLQEKISEVMSSSESIGERINSQFDSLSKLQLDIVANNSLVNKSYKEITDNATANFQELIRSMADSDVPNPFENMMGYSQGKAIGVIEGIKAELDDMVKHFNSSEINFQFSDAQKALIELAENTKTELTSSFDNMIEYLAKKGGIAPELAAKIIQDTQESMKGYEGVQILTDEEAAKVEQLYSRLQAAGDTTFQSFVLLAAKTKTETDLLADSLGEITTNMKIVAPQVLNTIKGSTSVMLASVHSLQGTVDSFMPSWLSQTLEIDKAFESVKNGIDAAGQQMVSTLMQGGSATEALSAGFGTLRTSITAANAAILANPILLLVAGVAALVPFALSVENSIKGISEKLGVSRAEAAKMHKSMLQIQASSNGILITQEDMTGILEKHNEIYGRTLDLNNKGNQESIKFASALGRQYGMAASEVYAASQQLQQAGASQETADNIMAWGAKAADLAGIPFKNITKDLAESSEEVALYFNGMPKQAMKAVIQIQKMGMTLKSVGKVMDKSLNIGGFMKDMTELTIMTGGSANLGKFFEMRHSGADAAQLAEEIANQYDNMVASGQANEYTMRKFAETTGMSVEELQKGAKIRQMPNQLSKEEAAVLQAHLGDLSDKALADAKSMKMAAQQLTTTEKLDAAWNEIKSTLSLAILPLAESLSAVMGGLAPAIKLLIPVFKFLVAMVKGMVMPFQVISTLFTEGWTPAVESFKKSFGELNGPLSLIKWTAVGIGAVISTYWAVGKAKSFFGVVSDGFKGIASTASSLKDKIMSAFGKKSAAAATDSVGSTLTESTKPAAETTKKTVDNVSNVKEPQSSGAKIKEFLTNLAEGLKAMAGAEVLKGALNLIPASLGLVVMIPGALGAKLLSTIDGEKLKTSLQGMASGLESMGTGKVMIGSLALVVASLGFIAMIPGAIGMGLVALLGAPTAAGLTALAAGITTFGTAVMSGVGAVGLLAFVGAAMGLAYALKVAAPGIAAFAPIIKAFGTIITSVFSGLSTLVETVATSFVMLIDKFASLEPTSLFAAAAGIGAIAIALAGFGGGSAIAGIGSAIGEFFGGDPIEKLTKLGELGPKLQVTSTALNSVSAAIKQFSSIDGESLNSAADGVSKLGEALATFGAGSAMEGIGSAIGEFFGGDIFEKLNSFASIGSSLNETAMAILSLASNLDLLNTSLSNLNVDKLNSIKTGLPEQTTVTGTIKNKFTSLFGEDEASLTSPKVDSILNTTAPNLAAVKTEYDVAKSGMVTNNTATNQSTTITQNDTSTNGIHTTMKQLLGMLEMYANRPVIVQIGDLELKSLNQKLKVYNNR